ncbi:MAG: anthranilate synthase component I family protein [Planctomycetes bacterium]|nr:anthranilate synthase component I family protein [Planctomycetota bacterium]
MHAAHPSDILDTLARWSAHLPAACWLGAHPAIAAPAQTITAPPRDALPTLRRLLAHPAATWLVALSYDIGRVLEPSIGPGPRDDRAWPGLVALRLDDAPPPAANAPPAPQTPGSFSVADFNPNEPAFVAGVRRIIEYIRAGDVYQANLAHRLSAPFSGSARALFHTWARAVTPLLGAYLEFDLSSTRCAILSASPELFLSFDAHSRRVTTRPMKGTRPGTADPAELERSDKDAAELNMIVDLMRNDLGRVCSLGSVRVDIPRAIERHGPSSRGVLQATSTISGDLRPGLDLADLLSATFPPGSVTGAPKVRAMQIIDELEPVSRGPYCGAIGLIRPDGSAEFSVTIRTALIQGAPGPHPGTFAHATLDYSVGAGIVADSDPDSEWQETLVKAAGFFAATRGPQHTGA